MSLRNKVRKILGAFRQVTNAPVASVDSPRWMRGVWCPIVGGLANQLICYRVGRMLSDLHGIPLFADLSHFCGSQTRPFLLPHFSPMLDVVFEVPSQSYIWSAQASDILGSLTARDSAHFWQTDVQQQLREEYLKPQAIPIVADLWVGLAFQVAAREYFRQPESKSKLRFNEGCLGRDERALMELIQQSKHNIAVHIRRTDFSNHDGGLLAPANQYNGMMQPFPARAGRICFSTCNTRTHLRQKCRQYQTFMEMRSTSS